MAYSRAIVKRAEARLQNEKEQNERFSRARVGEKDEMEARPLAVADDAPVHRPV